MSGWVSVTWSYDGKGVVGMKFASDRLSGAALTELASESLRRGGEKTRTQWRRAIREQGAWKTQGSVNSRTRSYRDGPFAYTLEARGKGEPIIYYKGLGVTSKGVRSGVWNASRVFQRSFLNGGYRARLTKDRFPVRTLKGPSVAKEAIKDQALQTFNEGAAIVLQDLARRIARVAGAG